MPHYFEMTNSYLTLKKAAEARFTVNKSLFIGHGGPCKSEQEALQMIGRMRELYRDASHNCYAYIIGENEGILRYSDDGEPGGTAGLPIISLLRAEKLVNCCVVVTRYFGGVLLGTGGLVRAYTQGCRIALDAAEIVRMELTAHLLCEVPYPRWDRLQYVLEKLPVKVTDLSYTSRVSFTLLIRVRDQDHVMETLMNASMRELEYLPDLECYEAWETKT